MSVENIKAQGKIVVNGTERKDVKLETLDIVVDQRKACKCPIMFIPGEKANKTNYVETEPYSTIVKENMMDYTHAFNYDGPSTSNYISQFLFNRFMDMVMTNTNIIFNSGILRLINDFTGAPIKTDVYETYEKYGIFNDQSFRDAVRICLSETFMDMEDNHVAFVRGITELKALYSTKLAQWLYNFINEITMNGYVDVIGLGRFMVFGNQDLSKVNPDKLAAINVSLHAVCIDGLLEVATNDICKVSEIIEPLFVNLYYSVMDYKYNLQNKIEEK